MTEETVAPSTPTVLGVGRALLGILLAFILVFGLVLYTSQDDDGLQGLRLPPGSLRGFIALLTIALLAVVIVYGPSLLVYDSTTTVTVRDATGDIQQIEETTSTDASLYTAVLAILATLTSAMSAFYFATRTVEAPNDLAKKALDVAASTQDRASEAANIAASAAENISGTAAGLADLRTELVDLKSQVESATAQQPGPPPPTDP
ncbi:MAG: hypothetical protein AAGA93_16305 [Actinomycetota bacterium]